MPARRERYWIQKSGRSHQLSENRLFGWRMFPEEVACVRRIGDGWSWRYAGGPFMSLPPELPLAEAKKYVEAVLRLNSV